MSAGEFLEAAKQAYALGFSIFPTTHDKKPAMPWKRFQKERMSMAELVKLFSKDSVGKNPIEGVGIIGGEVSGNLGIRDFDSHSAEETWEAVRPEEARRLPKVKTPRGSHRYFWSETTVETKEFADGELRGEGSYVLWAGSRHPTGARYELVIPFPSKPIRFEHPGIPGLNVCMEEEVRKLEEAKARCHGCAQKKDDEDGGVLRKAEEEEAIIASPLIRPHPSSSVASVEDAIRLTLPTAPGMRHKQVFNFARALKAVPGLGSAALPELRPHVREWHKQALPFIDTPEFDETWGDFVAAWPRVIVPLGATTIDELADRVTQLPPPPAAANYDSARAKLLLGLCAELQRQRGTEPFFLTTRTAAKLVNAPDFKATARIFNMFVADGLLVVVEKATPTRATRYRYVGLPAQAGGEG